MTDPLMTTNNNGQVDAPTQHDAFSDPDPTVDGGQAVWGGDLSEFDDDYDAAEAPSYEEVPDGKYQVRVQRVELGKSQAGDPMLKWDLVVIAGESGKYAGRHIFKNSAITHKSLPFVKGDLQTLGVVLARFSDLPNHLDALLDQALEVTKRTKGEYSNVYFNRRLELAAGVGEDGVCDEPAPF